MNLKGAEDSRRRSPRMGIRFQMFVALNALMTVLVSGFLVGEYRVDRHERLLTIRTALDEEARLLWLGSLQLRQADSDAAQAFVNDVLTQLDETHRSSHIVLVRNQAHDSLAVSKGLLPSAIQAMLEQHVESDDATFRDGGTAFMKGVYRGDGRTAMIAEDLNAIEAGIRADLSRHILSVLFLAVAGGAVINLVVTRVVIIPLEHLASAVQAIEQGALGTQVQSHASRESAALADTINQMSRTLASNQEERVRQMAKAKQIQEHLLPHDLSIPGLSIATAFRPADEVAGDFFDIIPLADGKCLFCLADVSGHGVSAALNAVMLKVLLSAAAERSSSPANVLQSIDAALFDVTLPEMFATMFVLRVCLQSGVIEYASAGHESGWLVRPDGELQELVSTGPPVGTDLELGWETRVIEADAGTRILLATDGVTEAAAPDGTLFTRKRLGRDFRDYGKLPLKAVLESIEQDVDRHCQLRPLHDDSTLLALEIAG